MKKVLVTGATGHIGNVLVRTLVNEGFSVRILTLNGFLPTYLQDLPLEVLSGDIRDESAVSDAVKGMDGVFHLAGIISISSYKSPDLYSVNVNGTENMIKACLAHNIKRLVYVSSVHALPDLPHHQLITPNIEITTQDLLGSYAKSKAMATLALKKAITQHNLNAVICFPAGVMGPYDYLGSDAGRSIKEYLANNIPFYIEGEYNFVDVRDVANGLIAAYFKGQKGEGYILAGEVITVKQIIEAIKSKVPTTQIPRKMPTFLALLFSYPTELIFKILNKKTPYTPYSVKVLQSNCNFSIEKSQQELGFKYRPLKESINDTIEWLQTQ
ncbi:MAG: SDR family NAD(P)-dependent oxidoreductase [Emticicia sp.]|nr:SDR family NAD(P)-dependent oxidoreductase [Emticicia sp.]